MRHPYLTLEDPVYYEAESVKGSRFLVNAVPVTSEEEAKAALLSAHAQFPHARHHCWAMCLLDPEISRPNDDGEPSGSAGKPILAQIQGRGLKNVIVIISRFFGGTKLGVGGLVRAYGGSAGQALDHAKIIQVIPKTSLMISFPYTDTNLVDAALSSLLVSPAASDYGEEVRLELLIEDEKVDSFIASFKEYTADRITVTRKL